MPDQLRDIKGVIYVFDWGASLFLVFLGLILAAFGYFLFKLLRQWQPSRKVGKKEASIPDRPFYELAMEALTRIDPVEYFEQRKVKEFYETFPQNTPSCGRG
jgi:hypothetical protein